MVNWRTNKNRSKIPCLLSYIKRRPRSNMKRITIAKFVALTLHFYWMFPCCGFFSLCILCYIWLLTIEIAPPHRKNKCVHVRCIITCSGSKVTIFSIFRTKSDSICFFLFGYFLGLSCEIKQKLKFTEIL